MTVNFVPRDIFIRHENEWKAIREAADERIEIVRRQKQPTASMIHPASVGKGDASAARSE
ncbi:hypothetical protein [Rhizobium bangladeshense]|uniref:hypothetical protein n=1 Tax=Rhizobium bangladeshense TaxID=1138189 RepID=UPI001A98825E|nr:hypothetical protein [Rhizobium bangladeshense]MBX4891603.1 hypothetical protein [Rhizobium bangladeshense]MBX4895773.1 hypothetical protein [Rhizobium bangladeshense]MBX4904188.1 hypothetical protein [Rhizobium bangladeshense]MBX4916099.1 hypothetical protein [Rhizobium bangladeshense]MBX4921673.1 hypothetical protein [Rhizobium bangladeshense]